MFVGADEMVWGIALVENQGVACVEGKEADAPWCRDAGGRMDIGRGARFVYMMHLW